MNKFYQKYRGKISVFSILVIVLVIINVFVAHDYELYNDSIIKIIKVTDKVEGVKNGPNAEKECYYVQKIIGKVMNGEFQGNTVEFKNRYSYSRITSDRYQRGMSLFINLSDRGENLSVSILGEKRDTLLLAVFFMAIGFNVIAITIIMTFSLCGVTLFYQNGNNEKTRTAFYVVIIVSIIMLFIVIVLSFLTGISGYNEISIYEEDTTFYDNNIHVNMMQVAAAVIIIGILGAVKDSAIAVTSGVYEVFRHNPKIEMEELFHAGLHMGYDILGTAVNTLFFACVGESMLLINRFYRLNYSFSQLINSKAFFQQLIIVAAGSIGIVLSIPIAAFVMTKVLSYNSSE